MTVSPKRKRNIVQKIILDSSWKPGENPRHKIQIPKNNFKEIQWKFFKVPKSKKISFQFA